MEEQVIASCTEDVVVNQWRLTSRLIIAEIPIEYDQSHCSYAPVSVKVRGLTLTSPIRLAKKGKMEGRLSFNSRRAQLVIFVSICWSAISVKSFQQRTHRLLPFARSSLMMSDEAPTLADFGKFMERKSRPDHVGVPRKRMELTFSVQLMRQSYAVVDDLDFVPMDEFQKDFFLFRQDEWEDYKGYHPTVMQGDLADPLYFDFIRCCITCVDDCHF